MLSPDEVKGYADQIAQFARENGRNPSEIEIAPQLSISIADTKEKAFSNFTKSFLFEHVRSLQNSTLKNLLGKYEGRMLYGSSDDIIEEIQKYLSAGVTHFSSLIIPANTLAEFRAMMKGVFTINHAFFCLNL